MSASEPTHGTACPHDGDGRQGTTDPSFSHPRRRRRRLAASAAVAASLLLSACGAGGGSGTASTTETGATADSRPSARIAVRLFRFQPATTTIDAGTTLTWTNEDDILHTVTSGRLPRPGVPGVSDTTAGAPDGTFDGDLDGRGTTFRFTFERPGTYTYYCEVHPGMAGRVVVQ